MPSAPFCPSRRVSSASRAARRCGEPASPTGPTLRPAAERRRLSLEVTAAARAPPTAAASGRPAETATAAAILEPANPPRAPSGENRAVRLCSLETRRARGERGERSRGDRSRELRRDGDSRTSSGSDASATVSAAAAASSSSAWNGGATRVGSR